MYTEAEGGKRGERGEGDGKFIASLDTRIVKLYKRDKWTIYINNEEVIIIWMGWKDSYKQQQAVLLASLLLPKLQCLKGILCFDTGPSKCRTTTVSGGESSPTS